MDFSNDLVLQFFQYVEFLIKKDLSVLLREPRVVFVYRFSYLYLSQFFLVVRNSKYSRKYLDRLKRIIVTLLEYRLRSRRNLLEIIRSSVKYIGSSILRAFNVVDLNIVFPQEFDLSNLSLIKRLSSYEIGEILIISIDLDLVLSSVKVVSPLLKYFDNSYQLFIVYLIVKLQSAQLLREERYRVQDAVIVSLS